MATTAANEVSTKYARGRAIASIIGVVAWLGFACGVVWLLTGVSSWGENAGPTGYTLHLALVIAPAFGWVFGSLVVIVFVHAVHAIFDIADAVGRQAA